MEQALKTATPGAAGSERGVVTDTVELRHTRGAKLWVLGISGFTLLLVVLSSLWPPLATSAWLSYTVIGIDVLGLLMAWREINLQMVRADAAGLTVRALWGGAQRVQWNEVASFSVEADARDKTSASSCLVTMRTHGILKDVGGSEIMNVLPTGRGHHVLKLKLNFGPEEERLKLKEFVEARLQEHGARKDFSRR